MAQRLPPIDKLPLALRKNVRDAWENEKESIQTKISDVMGTPWTLEVDPLAIYPYATSGWAKNSLGACIAAYFNAALNGLKSGVAKHGDEYRDELNSVAPTHVLALDIDIEDRVSYCGPAIIDGKLVILVKSTNIGTNVDSALDYNETLKAIHKHEEAASSAGISFNGRDSIREYWEPYAPKITKSLSDILQVAITVNPNFDAVFAALKAAAAKDKDVSKDFDKNLGNFMQGYFEALEYQLKSNKFHEDDLLREGFTEAVTKNEVAFRILDKLNNSTYCEVVVEDGTLYLQAVPTYFGTNISNVADGLVDQL